MKKTIQIALVVTAMVVVSMVFAGGGVSVGDADYVKETLEELGQVNFWRVAMKPGKPLAIGKINQADFFGVPGNPVSAMATFYQFVQPALQKLMGMDVAGHGGTYAHAQALGTTMADGFWYNNFATDLHFVDRSGTLLNTIVAPPSMYGCAYDNFSPGGPFLWLFTGTTTGGG